jgi:hypothetical protein
MHTLFTASTYGPKRNATEAASLVQRGLGLAVTGLQHEPAHPEIAGARPACQHPYGHRRPRHSGTTYIRLTSATPGSITRTAPQPTAVPSPARATTNAPPRADLVGIEGEEVVLGIRVTLRQLGVQRR